MPSDLSLTSIERHLAGRFGIPLRYVDETESTNSDALAWAAEGGPHGAMVVADHQTAGRGRWGRTWWSAPGRSLLFSLVLKPDVPVERLGLLTTAVGLACAEGIHASTGLFTELKWPNDVTIKGRKVSGTLVETRVAGSRVDVVVAGVGVNIEPVEGLPEDVAATATSLAEEVSGEPIPARPELLGLILESFESLYPAVIDPNLHDEILKPAEMRSSVLGRPVVIRLASGDRIEGRAARLLPTGALAVEIEGDIKTVAAGEVETVRAAGPP